MPKICRSHTGYTDRAQYCQLVQFRRVSRLISSVYQSDVYQSES